MHCWFLGSLWAVTIGDAVGVLAAVGLLSSAVGLGWRGRRARIRRVGDG